MKQQIINENGMKYLQDGRMVHIPMLSAVQSGDAEVICASEKGVALLETAGNVHFLSAADAEEASRMLELIDDSYMMVVGFREVADLAMEKYGFSEALECYYAAYLRKELLALETDLHIAPASAEDINVIKEIYHLISEEEIDQIFEAGNLFSAFMDGEFVGFGGFHLEGSMGLLEILPEHKRKGYGTQIETFLINEALRRGKIPYAEIVKGNDISVKLQEKLGLEFSKTSIWWLL